MDKEQIDQYIDGIDMRVSNLERQIDEESSLDEVYDALEDVLHDIYTVQDELEDIENDYEETEELLSHYEEAIIRLNDRLDDGDDKQDFYDDLDRRTRINNESAAELNEMTDEFIEDLGLDHEGLGSENEGYLARARRRLEELW